MNIDVTINMPNAKELIAGLGIDRKGKIQKKVDTEILRLSSPYTPLDQGELIKSGVISSGGGEIRYTVPYAREVWYIPKRFQGAPRRGNKWVLRMIAEGGGDKIARLIERELKK